MAALDLDRPVDHRQRRRCRHGARDRNVVPVRLTEHDPLACVQIRGREEEVVVQQAKVVDAVGVAQHGLQVALNATPVVEARGQGLGQPDRQVDPRGSAKVPEQVAGKPHHAQWQKGRTLGELERVGSHESAAIHVVKGRGNLLVDHPHHLFGRDPIGGQGGYEGARARADVHVELIDGAVDRQQVERAQRTNLIDPTGEPAAAQNQRGARAPRPPTARSCLRLAVLGGGFLELDDLAHPHAIVSRQRSEAPDTVFRLTMRRLLAIVLAVAAMLPAEAAQADFARTLSRQMRLAGSASGAYVINLTDGTKEFAWRAGTQRILASNTKLFTTAAALARFGTEGTLGTEVLGTGQLTEDGVYEGDLYLRGGGDPTFGSRRFASRSYGGGANVETLATLIEGAGIERVTGRVYGDESKHDPLRGGPDSGYGVSIWVGPLSALSFNRGLATESGRSYQTSPPAFAAARLDAALEARGIRVRLKPRAGTTPAGTTELASVESPPMETLVRLTNKASDNFFAEILVKDLAMQARGVGSTATGARLPARLAPPPRAPPPL